jgi:hypothetical protein
MKDNPIDWPDADFEKKPVVTGFDKTCLYEAAPEEGFPFYHCEWVNQKKKYYCKPTRPVDGSESPCVKCRGYLSRQAQTAAENMTFGQYMVRKFKRFWRGSLIQHSVCIPIIAAGVLISVLFPAMLKTASEVPVITGILSVVFVAALIAEVGWLFWLIMPVSITRAGITPIIMSRLHEEVFDLPEKPTPTKYTKLQITLVVLGLIVIVGCVSFAITTTPATTFSTASTNGTATSRLSGLAFREAPADGRSSAEAMDVRFFNETGLTLFYCGNIYHGHYSLSGYTINIEIDNPEENPFQTGLSGTYNNGNLGLTHAENGSFSFTGYVPPSLTLQWREATFELVGQPIILRFSSTVVPPREMEGNWHYNIETGLKYWSGSDGIAYHANPPGSMTYDEAAARDMVTIVGDPELP